MPHSDAQCRVASWFCGHSFFCPRGDDFSGLDRSWFEGVVRSEIVPLLKEYWFDNARRVEQAQEGLLAK